MNSRFAAESDPLSPTVGDRRIKYREASRAGQALFTRPFAGLLLIESIMRIWVDRAVHRIIRIHLRVVKRLQPILAFSRCTVVHLRREMSNPRHIFPRQNIEGYTEAGSAHGRRI